MAEPRNSLRGLVAIVTGASSGIGEATAKVLAKEGMRVCLAARRADELARVRKHCGRQTRSATVDISKPVEVKRLVRELVQAWERIDVLVNAAGIVATGEVDTQDDSALHDLLDTNLFGTILCCKHVFPIMKKQKGGHIVNISSVAGTRAQTGMAVYSASKFGVMGFSDALQQEAKPYGIKVSTIRPGTVITPLWGDAWTRSAESTQAASRMLKPEDIARSVVFALKQPRHVILRDIFIHPNA